MNESWKDAWWLSMFELKKMRKMTLWALLLVAFYTVVYTVLYQESNWDVPLFFEIIFLSGMMAMPYYIRTKDYQLKKLKGKFWGVPCFNFLLETPVPEKTLIKSKFITYFIQAGTMQALVLLLFYIFSAKLQSELSIGEFVVFFLFWWMFSQSFGSAFPANEVGRVYTIKVWVVSYLAIAAMLAAGVVYYYFTGIGVLEGSIFLAKEFPLLTLFISFVLLVLNVLYSYHYALKWLRKNNYM